MDSLQDQAFIHHSIATVLTVITTRTYLGSGERRVPQAELKVQERLHPGQVPPQQL
jgi:hypothetical protein